MAARFKVTAVAIVAVAVIAVAGVVIVVTASGSDDPQPTPERSAGSSPAAGTAAGTSASAGQSVGALTPAAASCAGPGPGMVLPAIAEVSQPARWAFAPDVVVDPHTGHATVAFAAAPAGALTPTSLWSVNLPGAHADQQLIRSGDDGEFPVPYDGGRWIPAERAHTLGIDAAGNQTLVWREEDRPRKQHGLDRMVIRGRVKTASRPTGGSWSRPTVLDSHLALTTETRVAVNDRGAAVAVWVHQTLPEVGAPVISLYASYRPAAKSQWSSPILVAQDELSTFERDFAYSYTPEIGIDRAGNAVVMYE